VIALALALLLAEGPASASVQGELRSAGERAPVAGARVFARSRRGPAWTREAVTARDGSFVLADLPARDFVLTIVAAGHERLEQPTTAAYWRARRPPVIYLQPTGAGTYRTIVHTRRDDRSVPTSTELVPEEFTKLPGSQGDPLRALQNLPGMARVPGGLGLLVIRGARPDQSQVFYGEHPLPRGFHIPGIASVLPAEALAGVRYVPGNFESNYGNAVGGIVVLTPRVGRRDGVHGHVKLDIISAGARVEGPWRRGSFFVAAQRNYLDRALKRLEPLIGPFVQPRSYDYQVIFDHPVGRDARLTVRMLGAGDQVRFRLFRYPETPSLASDFHRVDLAYRQQHGAWSFLLAPALRFDSADVDNSVFTIRRDDVVGLLRAEIGVRPRRWFALTLGADTQADRFRVTHAVPASLQVPARTEATRGLAVNSGAYLTATFTAGPVTLVPGLRVSAFTSEGTRAAAVDPRLFARWAPHERVSLGLGAGLYSQPSVQRVTLGSNLVPTTPLPLVQSAYDNTVVFPLSDGALVLPGAVRYLDARLEFDPRSPVGASRALHLGASAHVDLVAGLGLDASAFYRRVADNVPATSGASSAPPATASVAYGVEVLLRKRLSRRLHGWFAYTWLHADRGVKEGFAITQRQPADFDQRHNFLVVLQLALPQRWELGARFRMVTGLPYTPFLAGVFADPARYPYQPAVLGEANSARMPLFHQLDVRVDKTWVLRRSVVSAYFDIQNVYNRQNAEGILYDRYLSGTTAVVGVPILPVLGVRVAY
jgi:hypothetical protein